MRAILGDKERRFSRVDAYFLLAGPRGSEASLDSANWPAWMSREGRIRFVELPDPGPRYRVERGVMIGDHFKPTATDWTHWRIIESAWPAPPAPPPGKVH